MNDLISIEEIEEFRCPSKFIIWFEEYLEKTRIDKKFKKEILLHEGIAKIVYEEVFPLYRFLQIFGGEWPKSEFRNKVGNQKFDVEIKQVEEVPFDFIEITMADMNYKEKLRMQYFLENGHVSVIGAVSHTGTKRKRLKIDVEMEARLHVEVNREKKAEIKKAIERKIPKEYSDTTALLVYFDDYVAFWDEDDNRNMLEFIDNLEEDWEAKFSRLYFVGASGLHGWVKSRGERACAADECWSIRS